MGEKYNKPFFQQYKEAKIMAWIGIFSGLFWIFGSIIHIITDQIDQLSAIVLIIGSLVFIYSTLFLYFYWKCKNYQKYNKVIPKWFRIITAIFFIFYLTFYRLDTKKYHLYILLREIRFYVFFWLLIFIVTLILWFLLKKTNNNKNFWLWINFSILTIIFIINLTLSISIWKYKGTNSKLLKILTMITLNYRNYQLYKEIIELNTKEKADNY